MVFIKRTMVYALVATMTLLLSFIFSICPDDAFGIDNDRTMLSEYMTSEMNDPSDQQVTTSTPLVSTNGTKKPIIDGFIIATLGLLTVGIVTEAFLLYMKTRPHDDPYT